MGGSSETTSTPTAPPLDANAQALEATNVQIANAQLDAITHQNAMLTNMFGDGSGAAEMIQLQLQEARNAAAEQNKFQPLQDQLTQQTLENQLDMAKTGYGVTTQQKALIDQAADQSLQTGTDAINYGAADQMRQVRDYTAPGMGLRPSDSPVVDRQGLIAKAAEQSIGQLSGNVAQSKMSAYLGYPLQVAGVNSSTAQGPMSLPSSTIANQLGLAQAGGGAGGMALSGGQNYLSSFAGGAQSSLASLLNYQKGLISTTSTTQQNPGVMDYVKAVAQLAAAAA